MKRYSPGVESLMKLCRTYPEEAFEFEKATERGKEQLRESIKRIKRQKHPKRMVIHLRKHSDRYSKWINDFNPLIKQMVEKDILKTIKKEEQTTIYELSRVLECSESVARTYLERMVKKKILTRTKRGVRRSGVRGSAPIVYSLSKKKKAKQ